MAEVSVFRDVLSFFDRLGIYDVVLPFLLTFSIFFAILEKTKLFGTEKSGGPGGGDVTTKKNLNAMVAFCGSFFIIASSKMVNIIHEGLSNVILLLLISVSFLLLIGVFYKEGEAVALEGKWRTFMMILMFVAVVLIFAHAIPTDDGTPWLDFAYNYVIDNYNSTAVSAIILAIIVIGLMAWITKGESGSKEKAKS
jgi:hypothetical membrane protein